MNKQKAKQIEIKNLTEKDKGQPDQSYMSVPVDHAKQIAEEYKKSHVIILAWDSIHGLLHSTTYGVTKEQKHQAAYGGEKAAKALGADLLKMKPYEDFRKNELTLLESAKEALRSYQYGNASPDLAKAIADNIEALEKAKQHDKD